MSDFRGWHFWDQLASWGPNATFSPPSPEEAFQYCTWLATNHYENFPVLHWFVPRNLRPHFASIYAYSRWSDDLADEVGDPQQSIKLLDWWQSELHACYHGQVRHPVMVALRETVREFSIPMDPFQDLLTAFRQDQVQTHYETFAELLEYCRCSANPVGQLVLYLVRRHRPELVAMSDSICTGLQLANFWQDVAVDFAKGRIYLPREDRIRFGVEESELFERPAGKNVRNLLCFEVERAETLLRNGLPLVRHMRGRIKVVVALFAQGGLGILRAIKRQDYDVLSNRPKLRKTSYVEIGSRAVVSALTGGKR